MSAPWDEQPSIPGLGDSYIEPADRPDAWAVMARNLAAAGRTPAQIADALCIDEPTADLLALTHR